MKENLLKILKEIQLREEFKNSEFTLTLNYVEVLTNRFNKKEYLSFKRDPVPDILDESMGKLFEQKIDEVGEIHSFNFTNMIDIGTEGYEYSDGWKSVSYIFYSGEDALKDPKNTCFFEFNSLGDRGSLRLSQRLQKHEQDPNNREPRPIQTNICEYKKIGETLDYMLELDKVLDNNFLKEKSIIDRLDCSKEYIHDIYK